MPSLSKTLAFSGLLISAPQIRAEPLTHNEDRVTVLEAQLDIHQRLKSFLCEEQAFTSKEAHWAPELRLHLHSSVSMIQEKLGLLFKVLADKYKIPISCSPETVPVDEYLDLIVRLYPNPDVLPGIVALTFLLTFPEMKTTNFDYFFEIAMLSSDQDALLPAEAMRLLELPRLTAVQRERVAQNIVRFGTDIERHYLEKTHPDLFRTAQEKVQPNLTSGYSKFFGDQSNLDALASANNGTSKVNILVHPFFDLSGISFEKSPTIEETIVATLSGESPNYHSENRSILYLEALESFQEYRWIQELIENGEPILLVLPRFQDIHEYSPGEELADPYEPLDPSTHYASLLKTLFGDYPKVYVVETLDPNMGEMAAFYKEDFQRLAQNRSFRFGGGYIGKCFQSAHKQLEGWGLQGEAHVPALTASPNFVWSDEEGILHKDSFGHKNLVWMGIGLEGSAALATPPPTKEGLYAFFGQYPTIETTYNNWVERKLYPQSIR